MRKCNVYIHRRLAGELIEGRLGRDYTFRYFEEYLQDPTNDPVSLTMPLRREEYRSEYLFPYFFSILSEGSNRKVQSVYHHLDERDDFGILLETAQYDTPGIVTVMPVK